MTQHTTTIEDQLQEYLLLSEKEPNNAYFVKQVAYFYQQLQEYDQALIYHQRVEKLMPDDAWNWSNMGYCVQYQSNFYEALQCHLRAYQLDPNDHWNTSNLAYCYQQIEEYRTAIYYHELLLEKDPQDVWALQSIGYCYQELYEYKKAIEFYHLSDKYAPNNLVVLDNLGFCYQAIDQLRTSLFYFDKVRQIAPTETWNFGLTGWVHFRLGNMQKAGEFLAKNYELRTEESLSVLYYAHWCLVMGHDSEAMEAYQKSKSLYEDRDEFLDDIEEHYPFLAKQGIDMNTFRTIKIQLSI